MDIGIYDGVQWQILTTVPMVEDAIGGMAIELDALRARVEALEENNVS